MRRPGLPLPLPLAPVLAFVLATAGCGTSCGGDCAPLEVLLPAAEERHPWVGEGFAVIDGAVGGAPARLLLDTGFPHSAVTQDTARALGQEGVVFQAGQLETGPLALRVLLGAAPADAILGADVLHRVPHRHDARARTTTFLPRFDGQAATSAGVEVIPRASARCGAAGPFALRVRAFLEGREVFLLVDTGAQATFLRGAIVEVLDERARLTGLPVASAFAGTFAATATRARALEIGGAQAQAQLVLTAPEVDQELDRLAELYGVPLDGFLGWSFLREFAVTFTGDGPAQEVTGVRLARFADQDHWTREFVGIGILRAPSEDPPGIRVAGFLSRSPARDAGLLTEDVLTHADGAPLTGSSPLKSEGGQLELTVHRSGAPAALTVTLPYEDLLPDPS